MKNERAAGTSPRSRAAVRSADGIGTSVAFRSCIAETVGDGIEDFSKDQPMSRLRIPVAIVTSLVALFTASASLAEARAVQTSTPQVSTTSTTGARYAASEDRYSERTIEHRPNRSLLGTGAGIFVLSYGPSVIAAAASDRDADKKLFVPVAGPWLDLGDRRCNLETPCGANEDVAKAMIITSGVVQGAGVLIALSSLFIPESTTISERARSAKAKPEVRVLPVSFVTGAGVGAVGRF